MCLKNGFKIKFQFLDPDDNLVEGTEHEMIIPDFPENQIFNKNIPLGIQINIALRNVIFKQVGEYKSKIFIDGEEMGIYPIEVFLNDE